MPRKGHTNAYTNILVMKIYLDKANRDQKFLFETSDKKQLKKDMLQLYETILSGPVRRANGALAKENSSSTKKNKMK